MGKAGGARVTLRTQTLTKAITIWIKNMDMGSSAGKVGICTKEITRMMNEMDMVKCNGLMALHTEVNGLRSPAWAWNYDNV